jgi:MSHA pilin protein MshD
LRTGAHIRTYDHGFTLLELIITIVVLAVGIVGILSVSTFTTAKSADPIIVHQANAIAEAYLEEIMLQPFCDPDLSTTCVAACSGGGGACGNASCTATEGANRAVYDDVCDYKSLPDTVVRDRTGNMISGLGGYSVTVTVDDSASASLGKGGNVLSGSNGDVVEIDVTVNHAALSAPIKLTGYKADY